MPVLRYGASGAYVFLLQSVLKRLGYYEKTVDGIFGAQTLEALQKFQKAFGTMADGIVGENTWKLLMPYLDGSYGDIVQTDIIYPYSIMMMNLRFLQQKYPFLKSRLLWQKHTRKRFTFDSIRNR